MFCLTNSINELLDDSEALKALKSIYSVLDKKGVLILDQGQTEKSMKNPPCFSPIANDPDFSRLFTMTYEADIMTVNIFDFIHSEDDLSFHHNQVKIKIRLIDFWQKALFEAGFKKFKFFGSWLGEAYSKTESDRLIVVAKKAGE